MIFFEHLFIVIARFYIKTWNKYKNWSINVRYGITGLMIFNLGTVQVVTDNSMNKLIFLTIVIIFYLINTFINPKLNDKEFVKNYETNLLWEKIAITYIVSSIALFLLTFWIFVIGT